MNFIPILILFVILVNCEDYCNICDDHIGCDNDGEIAPKCYGYDEAKLINLKSTKIKDKLIELHNTKRNIVALGRLAKFKPASRMATMEWDNELAKLAEFNVKTCEFGTDKCYHTRKFRLSGQNVGRWSGKPAIKPLQAAQTIFDMWFNGFKDASMSIINICSDKPKTMGVLSFTVIVADRNIRLGCGMLQIVDDQTTEYLLTCNYAISNMIGQPIYVKGKTASRCKSGKNRKFPGLCSTKEKIDPNA